MRDAPWHTLRILMVLLISTFAFVVHAQRLTVAAASSLTEVMEELATAFEAAHPGVTIDLALAGSSTLATQILQGAPFDVFASANELQMGVVVSGGAHAQEPVRFVSNQLVVITPANSPVQTVQDLARDDTLLVLASPEVPVGAYARTALTQLNALHGEGFERAVLANLVSEEPNARQVTAKVVLGEADAALVYATDAAILDSDTIRVLAIDDAYNVTGHYTIASLTQSRFPELARAFVAFVLSSEGQALLAARGFGAPETPRAP